MIKVVNKKTGERYDLISVSVDFMFVEPEVKYLFSKGKNKVPVWHSSKDYYIEREIVVKKDNSIEINKLK